MTYLIILALMSLSVTWFIANHFMAGFAAHSIFWTATGFLAFAEILLFGILILNVCRKSAGKPAYVSMVQAAVLYLLFSLLVVFISPLVSLFFYIFASHFIALILLCCVVFALMMLNERNAASNEVIKNTRAKTFRQHFRLNNCAQKIKALGKPELHPIASRLELLAEQLKFFIRPDVTEYDRDIEKILDSVAGVAEACCAGADEEALSTHQRRLEGYANELEQLIAERKVMNNA